MPHLNLTKFKRLKNKTEENLQLNDCDKEMNM